jgi:hypothetical protein
MTMLRKNRNEEKYVESHPREFIGDNHGTSSNRNPPSDDIHQLPLTFNNCHFHLDGDKLETQRNTQIPSLTNLIADKMSKIGKQASEPPEISMDESFTPSSTHLKDSYSRLSVSELGRHEPPGFKQAYKSNGRNGPNYSKSSIKNDEYSFKSTEPSDYIRQGMEREKEVLETVHQELRNLSQDLKVNRS